MKTTTSLITMRIIMFYLLSVVGRAVAIEEAASSSLHIQQLHPLLNNMEYEEPIKKAYIAEYKRLPLYTFGIGKRWIDNNEDKRSRQFSFGIGKRLRNYDFGIGKRNNEYHPLNLDYFDNMGDYQSHEDNSNDFMENKRSNHQFGFGIGKRVWKLATGETTVSGRRLNDAIVPKYWFSILAKELENENLNQ
ncbi:PREDICTED: allatostatins [Acromyrmex echinatior]|uniref:Allatostatin n=1 Tax=Acromyrmex echinatior TaxID=103372 RepID=F4X8T3_ACREC|nr:PREDICTED: allatostatins [Acromyrmex echinatior]EGI57352.1 Allatostatin [Acromyrmex echinatior]